MSNAERDAFPGQTGVPVRALADAAPITYHERAVSLWNQPAHAEQSLGAIRSSRYHARAPKARVLPSKPKSSSPDLVELLVEINPVATRAD
jgi:hypothetical protein